MVTSPSPFKHALKPQLAGGPAVPGGWDTTAYFRAAWQSKASRGYFQPHQ